MNKTRAVTFLVAALMLIAAIGLILWKRHKNGNAIAAQIQASLAETNGQNFLKPLTSSQPTVSKPESQSIQQTTPSRTEQRTLAALSRNVPIDFWGKVIDQNGIPIAGVNVKVNTRTITTGTNGQPYTSFPQTNTVTDSLGMFEITGASGDVLTIAAMEKEGYETEAGTLKGFSYDPSQHFSSSQDTPVIFRLWPTGLKQQLISSDKIFKFIPDGRSYTVDFSTGAVAEGESTNGDLTFAVKRPDGVERHEPYEWSFALSLKDGGILQESNASYLEMTLAPSDGYVAIYKSSHKASDHRWAGDESHDRFYIKLRNGQIYGKMLINIDSFYDSGTGAGRMEFQYDMNPSGSQILR